MDVSSFKHDDWTKIWAWKWSFLSCSHFGQEYTKLIHFGKRPFMTQAIIFVSKGNSNCWVTQTERNILGKFLANQVEKNPKLAIKICNSLKEKVDYFMKFMDDFEKKEINLKDLKRFWQEIVVYYHPHINVKYVVDYLHPQTLKNLLPHFEEARIYAEPIFKKTEECMITLAKQISQKTKIPFRLILCSTYQEIEKYLGRNVLPSKDILEDRNKNSAIIFDITDYKIFYGKDIQKIEMLISSISLKNTLRGTIAYRGKVTGTVKIVLDPTKAKNFKPGDILVAGMTRPDYLPIMKKASAFITDAGGILSHAAIVARELKKPCIIGTQKATKILQDGDIVEIDANQGVIKILKHS